MLCSAHLLKPEMKPYPRPPVRRGTAYHITAGPEATDSCRNPEEATVQTYINLNSRTHEKPRHEMDFFRTDRKLNWGRRRNFITQKFASWRGETPAP